MGPMARPSCERTSEMKEQALKTGHSEEGCLRQGQNGAVLNGPCGILTKVCYRHFIKTPRNHMNVWYNGHTMSPLNQGIRH